jgi:putative hydrolase of the HAD superfamily
MDSRLFPAVVLFDLFGTLVAPFRRAEHIAAIATCSEALGIADEDCHRLWVASFPKRIRGDFGSVAENFEWICGECGAAAGAGELAHAERIYDDFTLGGLVPATGAIELLRWLREHGVAIGLVTNCAPDIPRLWERSAFAQWFDHCSFSCQVGSVKPEPAIYRDALEALGADPARTLYIGDGSDEELTGALAAGMTPVLLTNDLSNTYDARRNDVDNWSGLRVDSLLQIREMLLPISR